MRGIEVAKQDTITRPGRAGQDLLERGHHRVLACGRSRVLDVRAVREQHEHATIAPGREGFHVGALFGRRGLVDLEVAAREHHAGRGLDGEGEAVEHTVGHLNGVDAKRTRLDRRSRSEGAQIRVHAAIGEALAREAEGQAAAVDRRGCRSKREGEGANVVLVPVGEQDRAQLVAALGEVVEVGNDRLDPRELGIRKQETGVDQQKVLVPLDDHRVQAELTAVPRGGPGEPGARRSSPPPVHNR